MRNPKTWLLALLLPTLALADGGPVGGSAGQIEINGGGIFSGITLGGDCTFSSPNITCLTSNGNAIGYLGTPIDPENGTSFTVPITDRGKTVELTSSSGGAVTIPISVFSAGDVFSLAAFYGTATWTISVASGGTLDWANGTSAAGTRTLTSVGLATILCITGGATPVFIITGAGIS